MVLFVWGRWRYDIVALIALLVSTAVGAVPLNQVFSGLPNPAVVTVACVMVISQTITRSGLLNVLINKLDIVNHNPIISLVYLCFTAMLLSFFMNNVGALALMMPVAIKIAIEQDRSPSLVLMPVAFASGLGGLATVIGTPPNLLIAAYRQEITGHAFTMFDYTPVGAMVAVVGVLFIALFGYRLIPKKRKAPQSVADMFDIKDYIFEVHVDENAAILDMSLSEIKEKTKAEYEIVTLIRGKSKRLSLPDDFIVHADDILIIEASAENLKTFLSDTKTKVASDQKITRESLQSKDIQLVEAVVPQGARIEGRTTKGMRLFARFQLHLLAISREGNPFKQRLDQVQLKPGDITLFQGPSDTVTENIASLGLLPLIERHIQIETSWKMIWPLIVFVIAIILTALSLLPVQVAFGGAVIVMVIFNWISPRSLYESIDWPVIILLAAMIPVGSALQTTGGTAMIAEWLSHLAAHTSPITILVLLMIIAMTVSDFMNNAATAIVMAPIANGIANSLQVNIDPFLMGVAIACSCSFLTPVGHQNNILVMGPGGYKFGDYLRLGLPLEIIVLCVSVPMILWVWPLR